MEGFERSIRADGADKDGTPNSPTSPEQREDCIRKDIRTRIKGVCKDLSEAEFEGLVTDMTREQLRSERHR